MSTIYQIEEGISGLGLGSVTDLEFSGSIRDVVGDSIDTHLTPQDIQLLAAIRQAERDLNNPDIVGGTK